jgi:hypothetical protein
MTAFARGVALFGLFVASSCAWTPWGTGWDKKAHGWSFRLAPYLWGSSTEGTFARMPASVPEAT